ncbi:MAG: hypothetical protein PHO83_17610, partial [Geobacteraceae bacterium]|nr:hypothetical protein [Geobacteraceae bacterium]
IDISLDPFPYNGTTTTCESLWMGVPVITLCGDRHAERVGASLLSSVGLEELIAYDKEEYLRIACQLTSEPAKLARLRSSLRKQVAESKLCDKKSFTRQMETLYQELWEQWATSSKRFQPEEV